MTMLADIVSIDHHFARSARLDIDIHSKPSLTGYVLQATVANALEILANNQYKNKQGAYTWTGPYGGGKSSAALLLTHILTGPKANRKIAQKIVGGKLTNLYTQAFPENNGQWKVIAVTGSRMRLRDAIISAAQSSFGWTKEKANELSANDEKLIAALISGVEESSGTLLILDELGKLLEHEAIEGGDIHLLQDLAEYASRSDGRLVVIGILHQSFEQYTARAERNARKEWAKVQGRYQDIPFLSGADETVTLLGQAIKSSPPSMADRLAHTVAKAVAKCRPTEIQKLTSALVNTWPLNPVTTMLLGPVSRAWFAQNERSVFGFLSSAEPAGFQDFLSHTKKNQGTYNPEYLWDYLVKNFGMALVSGTESSRFSLAFEAIERAGAKGEKIHITLTKTAAVIEFFRHGSGIALTDDFLVSSVPNIPAKIVADAIQDLLNWAILIKQPRLGGYALFAGSDFDIEEAISHTLVPVDNAQLQDIPQRVGFGFTTAKRHYFRTGTLRTFEIGIHVVSNNETMETLAKSIQNRSRKRHGLLILLLNDGSTPQQKIDTLAKDATKLLENERLVIAIGSTQNSFAFRNAAAELIAIERIFQEHPQLEGDRIARREIAARHSYCIDQLHQSLETAIKNTKWFLAHFPNETFTGPLTVIASKLADTGYAHTPILKSELLQRDKLSASASAALKELMHAMVKDSDKPQLGMSGYPAELGLYLTIIQPFGLHRKHPSGKYSFFMPDSSTVTGRSLQSAWEIISETDNKPLDEIYRRWMAPPYGIKKGVMPVIALAYMLANRDLIAIYIDGIYQTTIDDVVTDKLLQKPASFRLRKIDRSVQETAFLSNLAIALGIDSVDGSLPVAAALFQRFETLPNFAKRTTHISEDARVLRSIVLKANDPEQLLFNDLPNAFGKRLSADLINTALLEIQGSYPKLLKELQLALARALGVDNQSFKGITERVASVKGLTNDYSFDAFADRAAALELGTGDIESLVSVLLHRPARNWSNRDREEALTEIARYGRRFRELEALALVRDRQSQAETLALVVGLNPKIPPMLQSFVLTDQEKSTAAVIAAELVKTLHNNEEKGHLHLAALARAVAQIVAENNEEVI